MPYLELAKDAEDENANIAKVEVPNVVGLTIKEAYNVLKENSLIMNMKQTEEMDKETTIVKKQVPSSGIIVNGGSNVYLEY